MYSVLLALAPLVAGEIFGDLRLGDAYLADVPIRLTCGAESVEAKTDSTGSFRLRARNAGKCLVQVMYRDQRPTLEVVVFDQPTRYRFVLENQNGSFVLKRV